MKRVLAVDVLRCGDCGARRQVIVRITDPDPIARFLTHPGLAGEPPPVAPTRPLPDLAVPF